MPIYSFFCESCNLSFEAKLTREKAGGKHKCPQCNSQKHVFRDFLADNVSVQEAQKTLGSLADKNTKKFSDEYKAKLMPNRRKLNES